MSLNVTEIVLHQLHQTDGESPQLNTVLRENLLAITPEVEQMMLQLH